MKSTKLFLILKGGLGNQIFQYAAARSLAISNDFQLLLDNWTGFAFDYKYRRNYELGPLPENVQFLRKRDKALAISYLSASKLAIFSAYAGG